MKTQQLNLIIQHISTQK